MTNTSTHPWQVNGFRLDTLAYNIREKKGWLYTPGFKESNLEVPGRAGEIWVPGKRRDTGQVTLAMTVFSTDDNGAVVGSDRYATWRSNFDTLLQIFDSTYELLDVQHTHVSGGVRQLMAEVSAAVNPSEVQKQYMEFAVLLAVPGVYWQDTADVTWTSTTGAGAVALHAATQFLGATAPMEDLWLVVDGPITNPRITDERTGHYIQYNGTVANGTQWVVNTTTWSSKTGTAIEYTTGGTVATALTVSDGLFLPRLFALSPAKRVFSVSPVAPAVRLGGTGASTNTRLRIRGRRKYL